MSSRLSLLIAGVVVVLFSTAVTARVLGWGPGSGGDPGNILALDRTLPGLPGAPAPVEPRCPECGVIVSMREIAGGGADADSAAAGHAGPGRRYEITLRQVDRANRVISLAGPMSWRAGERVIVIDGAGASSR